MINKIINPFGETVTRKRCERQKKFERRVNNEFREKVKEMFKYDFKNSEFTQVILKFQITDMFGHNILFEQHCLKSIKQKGFKGKYISLKIKFEE